MKKSTKVWIGIGVFVMTGGGYTALASAPGVAALTKSTATVNRNASAKDRATLRLAQMKRGGEGGERSHGERGHGGHGEGGERARAGGESGEGGEGGEGGARLSPDLKFARDIALIRGHLLIGDQLVAQMQWDAAFPHFMHPAEEIYEGIENDVAKYGTPNFEDDLKALATAVKAKSAKDYGPAKAKVEAALTKADAGIKAKQPDAAFAVRTALETLKIAASEYKAAITKGRISKPVEYQDARGFVLHAEAMVEGVAADFEKKGAVSLKNVRTGLVDLKTIFPTAMPPKKPVKSAGAMRATVSRIELAASNLR